RWKLVELPDVLFQRVFVQVADGPADDLTAPVDEERGRQEADRAVEVEEFLVRHGEAELEAHLLPESLHGGRIVVVDREAEHHQAVPGMALLKPGEVGQALAAGGAPGGPEVEDDRIAALGLEAEGPAVERP